MLILFYTFENLIFEAIDVNLVVNIRTILVSSKYNI